MRDKVRGHGVSVFFPRHSRVANAMGAQYVGQRRGSATLDLSLERASGSASASGHGR